jgi:phage FluMu gp28-like protein
MSYNPPRNLFTAEERLNFAEAFIKVDQQPVELDFWQQDYIKDINKYGLTLKSRRTGYSFIVSLKGIVKSNDKARYKYTRQFVSYNEEDAKEKINYAKEFYHSIPKRHRKELASETKTSMEFYDKGRKTVSRLLSIACRPPRGRGGDIVLDEWAIYPKNQSRIIYTAALPVISRGGCIEGGSTALGKIGAFYDVWDNVKDYPYFTRFMVPWWASSALCINVKEAVKLAPFMETEERVEMFGTDTLKTILSSMFLEDFQQEFECYFIDSAQSYISLDLIYANTPGMREHDRNRELEDGEDEKVDEEGIEVKVFKTVDELLLYYDPEQHGDLLYLGYDVARTRDAAEIFIIGLFPNGKKKSVASIEMVNQPFEYQRDQIRKLMRSGLPIDRGCIDKTGIGIDTTETLQGEFTETKLEGVMFNVESKDVLARDAKEGLEKNEFLLQNDNRFHRQIHSIKRIPMPGGAFRYDSERDEMGHADKFWAWALANHAIPKFGKAKKSFYDQYRERRQLTPQGETADTGIVKRGKSASSVMRSMGIK